MLILTRKFDERVKIQVGEVLVDVLVVELRDRKVRLGFEAPDGVVIHRAEVFDAIARSGQKRQFPQKPA